MHFHTQSHTIICLPINIFFNSIYLVVFRIANIKKNNKISNIYFACLLYLYYNLWVVCVCTQQQWRTLREHITYTHIHTHAHIITMVIISSNKQVSAEKHTSHIVRLYSDVIIIIIRISNIHSINTQIWQVNWRNPKRNRQLFGVSDRDHRSISDQPKNVASAAAT